MNRLQYFHESDEVSDYEFDPSPIYIGETFTLYDEIRHRFFPSKKKRSFDSY